MQPEQPSTPKVELKPATSETIQPLKPAEVVEPRPPEPAQMPKHDRLYWIKTHKPLVAVIATVVILLPAVAFGFMKLRHKPKPAPVTKKVAPAVTPTEPIISPLTGLTVTADVRNQPIFGVVIENSPEARPQSGLSQAGVVYETLAEGGITRFLAIYLDQQPSNIGPVRSLRPYFIDWAQEYSNPPVAHAGGSAQALATVPQVGFKSMNGLNYGKYFRRAGDRSAPHNLYTSTANLINLMNTLKWTTNANFTPWKYKTDSALATPTHPTINVNFSYALFTAKYTFDPACDCYNRFLAGVAHVDRNTGKQIQVKNVAVITVQTAYDKKGHALDTTIGSGKAVVFRDGDAVVGTWKKDARTSRIQFLDATGQPIPLNPGNTWVEAIAQTGSVSY